MWSEGAQLIKGFDETGAEVQDTEGRWYPTKDALPTADIPEAAMEQGEAPVEEEAQTEMEAPTSLGRASSARAQNFRQQAELIRAWRARNERGLPAAVRAAAVETMRPRPEPSLTSDQYREGARRAADKAQQLTEQALKLEAEGGTAEEVSALRREATKMRNISAAAKAKAGPSLLANALGRGPPPAAFPVGQNFRDAEEGPPPKPAPAPKPAAPAPKPAPKPAPAPAEAIPPPETPKYMKTRTFSLEQQLIARLRDGAIENDEEADLLTKRRQALWTERSRMKGKESGQAQEVLRKSKRRSSSSTPGCGSGRTAAANTWTSSRNCPGNSRAKSSYSCDTQSRRRSDSSGCSPHGIATLSNC